MVLAWWERQSGKKAGKRLAKGGGALPKGTRGEKAGTDSQ